MYKLACPPGYMPVSLAADEFVTPSTYGGQKLAQWWSVASNAARADVLAHAEALTGRDRVFRAWQYKTGAALMRPLAPVTRYTGPSDDWDTPPDPNVIDIEYDDDDDDLLRDAEWDGDPDEYEEDWP